MGSDHEVFEEASFGVPMVYFHDWPDVTIHTNKDQPENLDATKLGRVAYLGAGIAWTLAALPDAEAPRLLALTRARRPRSGIAGARRPRAARRRPADARALRARGDRSGDRDAALAGRALARAASGGPRRERPALAERPEALPRRRPRHPRARPQPGGPRTARRLLLRPPGRSPRADAVADAALAGRAHGDVLAYECLNLVDGKRSVSEIRDVLTGRYEPISIREIAEYLELLGRAKVITWR